MAGPFYFAYCGGAIEAQVTLVTNGTTHGARPERVSIVGDVNSGSAQLTNIASNEGLVDGALYHLNGTGIDAYFIFDNSILSGLPGSLNLSAGPTASERSATFQATKSDIVGTVLGTLSHGSSTVILDAPGLASGTYGIVGTGIGETDVPVGTETGTTYVTGGGVMIIGSAYITYAGGGTAGMSIYAATPHTHDGFDVFGQPTKITTYTIAPQPVRATASGQFAMQLTGFPTGDPATVTGIPSSALMGLTPGLVYNITGNGIPVGATFIAPNGGTSITLDVNATASDINAILTITGPRTPNAAFDAGALLFDEEIVSFDISQEEGGFATLTIDVKNPGTGLLAVGRHLWCWLSWDKAWDPAGNTPDLEQLFNGRLIGVPKLQAGEIVQLQFLARPDDFNAQKKAWADYLAVLPYYDPIWYATSINPDTVLETYSALWHIDRRSLSVTISDILEGEDGIIDVGEDWSIYDRFSLSYGQPPLVATNVEGTVSWSQEGEGTLDVTQSIVSAFHTAGSAYHYAFATGKFGEHGGGLIQCLCGDGLKSDWPKPGISIGGGWTLTSRNDYSGVPLCYILDATDATRGGWLSQVYYSVIFEGQMPPPSQAGNTQDQSNVNVYVHPFGTFHARFPLNVYKIRMNLDYRANRKRTETVSAVVMAGVQQELSDSAENDRESIAMTSEFVGQAVDLDGSVPIGNLAYRSYFQTARGASSFEYLLLAARAKMRARARAVDITFAVAWPNALGITLRHSVQLTDRRLPGGSAVGKVKSYKLSCSGNGVMLGEFTIGCAIGTGDGTAPQPGVPAYVETDYVDDYQAVTGAQIPLAASSGDVAYQTLDDFAIVDDGLDLTNVTIGSAVNECVVANGMKIQLPILSRYKYSFTPTYGNPMKAMSEVSTTVTLDLKPVQGAEFHTEFTPAVTPLILPKTIDLSAPLGA